jgi:hypothetical protein
MNNEKFFSLAEANALIPQIELIMSRMQRFASQIQQEMEHLIPNFNQSAHDGTIAQLLRLKPELQPLFTELSQSIQEIEKLGGSFKGLDLGLVDFPAKIGGETVELCWQYGEKEITYYHRRDEGFAGRRLLKPQPLGSRTYQH